MLESASMSVPEGTRRPARLAAWLLFVSLVALIGYVSRALGSEPPEDVLYRYSTAVGLVLQSALFLGILLLITIGLPKRELFGLRQPASWGRALALAGAGLLLIFVLSIALSPVLDAGEEQGLLPEEWDSDRLVPYAVVGLSIATIGPLVEELMFRGVGFALLEPYGKWVAIVGTGVLFGALHGLVIAFPVLAAFGIVLGWLRWKTGSVYPCVLLHGAFNAIGVLTVPFAA
jgi:membrane protease YdiL (CAAX protease family)